METSSVKSRPSPGKWGYSWVGVRDRPLALKYNSADWVTPRPGEEEGGRSPTLAQEAPMQRAHPELTLGR